MESLRVYQKGIHVGDVDARCLGGFDPRDGELVLRVLKETTNAGPNRLDGLFASLSNECRESDKEDVGIRAVIIWIRATPGLEDAVLEHIAKYRRFDCFKHLERYGVNVTARAERLLKLSTSILDGYTTLHLLEKYEKDISMKTKTWVLHDACQRFVALSNGHGKLSDENRTIALDNLRKIIPLLIRCGADKNENTGTVLEFLTESGDLELVTLLLKHGRYTDDIMHKPFYLAMEKDFREIALLIFKSTKHRWFYDRYKCPFVIICSRWRDRTVSEIEADLRFIDNLIAARFYLSNARKTECICAILHTNLPENVHLRLIEELIKRRISLCSAIDLVSKVHETGRATRDIMSLMLTENYTATSDEKKILLDVYGILC
jgi:hypothetical protein